MKARRFDQKWPYSHGGLDLGYYLFQLLKDFPNLEHTAGISIIAIGSPSEPGDALGPLVGDILCRRFDKGIILGTSLNPVDATNLKQYVLDRQPAELRPLIIAVDAAQGHWSSLGRIIARPGSIWPALSRGALLPPVGDISITGTVMVRGSKFSAHLAQSLFGSPRLWALRLAPIIAEAIAWAVERFAEQRRAAGASPRTD